MKRELSDSYFGFAIVILGAYFLVRLIDQSHMLTMFPLDYANDYASHIAKIFFMDKCGFGMCPYWYNGVDVFLNYPPGFFLFVLPIYKITQNLLLTNFIGLLLLYIAGFFIIFYFGKLLKLSIMKRIAFFVLFFFNASAIGNFLRLGRLPEMFAWVNFIAMVLLMIYFLDKKLDWRAIFISVFYALTIIGHQTTAILASVLFLFYFIAKKDRWVVMAFGGAGLALSAWWWAPYLLNVMNGSALTYVLSSWLFQFGRLFLENIIGILLALATFILFIIFIRDKSKEEKIFFSCVMVLIALYAFRLVAFIPILKYVYPDPYFFFTLFFAIYFLMKIKPTVLFGLGICFLLALVSMTSLVINQTHTPYFHVYHEKEKEAIEITKYIDGKFFFDSNEEVMEHVYDKPYYAYAATQGKLAVGGWNEQFINNDYKQLLNKMITHNTCEFTINNLHKLNATEVVTFTTACDKLKECGFIEKKRVGEACLYLMK